jgi:FtsH-binding integral membrane protein
MQDPRFILLLLMAVGCIAAPVSVIRSRRRAFEAWAKVASVLLCIFGLAWTGLAFSLIRMGDTAADPIGVLLTHARTFLGGVCVGLVLAVLIARPYKTVTSEKAQTEV